MSEAAQASPAASVKTENPARPGMIAKAGALIGTAPAFSSVYAI